MTISRINVIQQITKVNNKKRQDDMQVAASPAGGPNPVIQGAQ